MILSSTFFCFNCLQQDASGVRGFDDSDSVLLSCVNSASQARPRQDKAEWERKVLTLASLALTIPLATHNLSRQSSSLCAKLHSSPLQRATDSIMSALGPLGSKPTGGNGAMTGDNQDMFMGPDAEGLKNSRC
ncbi:hypothetical protein FOXYSP1_05324 [Fusarium oxysporum f. sp. phaseoli]